MLPIAIVFTAAPVLPMLIVSALASVPMLIVPVVPELRVRLLAVPEEIVRAPESAMLFVVNVWLPMVLPVMKDATPPAEILQLLSVRESPVTEALPMFMVEAVAELPMLIVSAPPLPRLIVSVPVEPRVTVVALPAVKEVPDTVRFPVTLVFSARDMFPVELPPRVRV